LVLTRIFTLKRKKSTKISISLATTNCSNSNYSSKNKNFHKKSNDILGKENKVIIRGGSAKNFGKEAIPSIEKQKLHLGVNDSYSLKIKNPKKTSYKLENENEKQKIMQNLTKRSNSLLSAGNNRSLDHSSDENKEKSFKIDPHVQFNNLNSSCISFLSSQSEKSAVKNKNLSAISSNFPNQSRQNSIHKITNISIGNCVSDVSTSNSLSTVKAIYEQADGNNSEKNQNDSTNYMNNNKSFTKNSKTDQSLLNVNKKIVIKNRYKSTVKAGLYIYEQFEIKK
jgi:hypothetical protein